MTKKLVKALLATVTCATIVVGGASVAVNAMSDKVRVCDHEYYIVDDYWMEYVDCEDGYYHEEHEWEERFCMDCMYSFDEERSVMTDMHSGFNGGVCSDCGGNIDY